MGLVSLVLVPDVFALESGQVSRPREALVLEDVLYSGLDGHIFRRLRVLCVLNPEARPVFERLRSTYLQAVVEAAATASRGNLVVVGTRPSDADLYAFDYVIRADLPSVELERLGSELYGDTFMLWAEARGLKHASASACDACFAVHSWAEFVAAVAQRFPGSEVPQFEYTSVLENLECVAGLRRFGGAVTGPPLDQRKFEQHVGTSPKFKYLSSVAVAWREAVVRVLGPAPLLSEFYCLPAAMVVRPSVEQLVVGVAEGGHMRLGVPGQLFGSYIRSRVDVTFDVAASVGTWAAAWFATPAVGARVYGAMREVFERDAVGDCEVPDMGSLVVGKSVESEDQIVGAVHALNSDGSHPLDDGASGVASDEPFPSDLGVTAVVKSRVPVRRVPAKYSWAFILCRGIVVTDGDDDADWLVALVRSLGAIGDDPYSRVEVQVAVWRLINLYDNPTYLEHIAAGVRVRRAADVGLRYSDAVVVGQLYGYGGDPGGARDLIKVCNLQGYCPSQQGYCYLGLFPKAAWDYLGEALGPLAPLRVLLRLSTAKCFNSGAVWVRYGMRSDGAETWHLVHPMHPKGVPWDTAVRSWRNRGEPPVVVGQYSEQPTSVCYTQTVFVAMIIGWSMFGTVFLGVLMWWLLWLRPRAKTPAGGYRRAGY